MGVNFSHIFSYFFPHKQCKLILVGLDNAGKTTALYRLNLGQVVTTTPTIGSNVETVKYNNMTFEMWDLGGQASLRSSWSMYFEGTDAIIMVVDSTDRARMSIVQRELTNMLADPLLKRCALLVLANKQDLKDAMGVMELTEALALQKITTHDWQLQPCCATTGEGLLEGLGWISQRINIHLRNTSK